MDRLLLLLMLVMAYFLIPFVQEAGAVSGFGPTLQDEQIRPSDRDKAQNAGGYDEHSDEFISQADFEQGMQEEGRDSTVLNYSHPGEVLNRADAEEARLEDEDEERVRQF